VYYYAKLKLIKATKPMKIMIKIVPVDVERGTNVIEAENAKFPWFDGPSLTTIVHEDQERTNFDEEEYRKLAEEPLVIHNYHVHLCCRPVVAVGRVIRKSKRIDQIMLHFRKRIIFCSDLQMN
jgi:translation elongation factor EF-1alpha